jgi:type IV pilus biogenesis protein CpaD/CtpE
VNDLNLDIQIANAADLRKGRGSPTIDGETAAAPIDRLRRDKTRPLPTPSASQVGAGGGGTGGGGG